MRLAAFTDSGYFWLPGDKGQSFQVAGTLAVSEAGRVTLETFGYLDDDALSLAQGIWGEPPSNIDLIFGFTKGQGAVTLVDSIPMDRQTHFTATGAAFGSSRLWTRVLLVDVHRGEQGPQFNRLICKIEGLDEWLGISGITATKHDLESRRTSITYEVPPPVPFQAGDDVKGQFGFGYSIPGFAPWATEARVSQSACIQLSTSASWTAEDVIDWATRMRDFLSLGTDAPVAITSLDGYLQGGTQEAVAKGNREHPVSIFFQSTQHSPEPATVRPGSMSFAYHDLGDELSNALTNWIDLCREWPQPVRLFFDARYGDGILSGDLQFRKVVEALETLAPARCIGEGCEASQEDQEAGRAVRQTHGDRGWRD